jgi:hypothetical protein
MDPGTIILIVGLSLVGLVCLVALVTRIQRCFC